MSKYRSPLSESIIELCGTVGIGLGKRSISWWIEYLRRLVEEKKSFEGEAESTREQ